MSRLPLPVALLLACALLLAACGSDKEKKAAATPAATDAPEAAQTAGCEKVAAPKPRTSATLAKPTERLNPGKTYVAHVETSCGAFDITLDPKRSPRTGGSFASLVRKHFYDDLTFHRIVAGFVIQGGDPEGKGSGGPGYSVVESPPQDTVYSKGVVAMAKTATEPAGTSGSQFFVVTGEDAGLPPEYALLGKVTKGQEVVDKIGVLQVGPDEAPTQPVVIHRITIAES
jgi:peptidyl-prolyl cis-trans isomerase B (cyclophilin B)